MITIVLLAIAAIGALSSTVFLVLAVLGALRFRRRAGARRVTVDPLPPVTVLKPLHGDEPNLRSNLASFFRQDYPAPFELIFAARSQADAGLLLARQLADEFPGVRAKFVVTGEPPWPNAKVYSLARMLEAAAYECLVISDSDVFVAPEYLRNVVAPLTDSNVGLVTCVYRGRNVGGFWSRLEALGMTAEMSSGVMVADMLEGMKFALGPSMSTKRSVLQEIGGVQVLGDYCADDFMLGHIIAAAGHRVELSHHVIDHYALHRTFHNSVAHQVRWMRSTRFSRPAGHFGTGLTFATPFALIAAIAAPFSNVPAVCAALAAWGVLNPVIQAAVLGWVLRDRHALRLCWLYPVRNLLGFAYWLGSYASSSVQWRAETYQLYADGKMRPLASAEPLTGQVHHR
ncbi:MAG TPA: bacteriohopanetetrol glucosamine biosynthesis glycosyltransferase HpnI [Clostridia bacterium]|nr:bacteriohopanetetrol glucosamine biosynthesis glycosyltransferase HpnI [Clostridia bacterium]